MTELEKSWADTCSALGLSSPLNGLYQELCRRYGEPHRKYHTLQHLGECLALCRRDSALAEHPAEVAFALWFHDAIHEPGRSDNEAESAAWARSALLAAGAETIVATRVHALVMATRHREVPDTTDARWVADIDLAILAAEPERFDEYERQIRAEYRHVPELLFRTKRRAVLQSFLERPRIYATSTCHERYEAAARANLRRSLDA